MCQYSKIKTPPHPQSTRERHHLPQFLIELPYVSVLEIASLLSLLAGFIHSNKKEEDFMNGVSVSSNYYSPITAFAPWIAILIMAFIIGALVIGYSKRRK
jgi:hypothetical protein